MSFLAQLRAQQTPTQPLKLFYVFILTNHAHNCLPLLQLQLRVGEAVDHPNTKTYSPQSQHLTLPPPFIYSSDKPLLEQLLNNPNHNGWPVFLHNNGLAFLPPLLATGRAYLQQTHNYLPITGKTKKAVFLEWQIQSNGEQQLTATQKNGLVICQTSQALNLVGLHVEQNTATLYECDLHGNTGPISPLQQQQITQLLEARHFCLNAQAVAAFLHEHASNWQNQGIPLPKVVDVMPLNAQVRGAVLCHSHNQQDTLSLSYIYITKDYCTWFNSTDDQPHYVLLNNNLCVITRKKRG